MVIENRLRVSGRQPADNLDLLVIAVGYEARSRNVAAAYVGRAQRKVAFSFESVGFHSFDENLQLAADDGYEIRSIQGDFAAAFGDVLRTLPPDAHHVGIDISSFTRFHLAEILDTLRSRRGLALEIDFLYSPASSDGWQVQAGPIRVAEPIHPAFASWTDDPSLPLTAIIGVGVEENLALGVAEYLDVSAVYAFTPSGSDPGFDAMGVAANEQFFVATYLVRSTVYDLLDPFDLFTRLESLVYGLRRNSRVAIVPLGPKLFALCALLATTASERATTVWRFSGDSSARSTDVKARGFVVSLRVQTIPAPGGG